MNRFLLLMLLLFSSFCALKPMQLQSDIIFKKMDEGEEMLGYKIKYREVTRAKITLLVIYFVQKIIDLYDRMVHKLENSNFMFVVIDNVVSCRDTVIKKYKEKQKVFNDQGNNLIKYARQQSEEIRFGMIMEAARGFLWDLWEKENDPTYDYKNFFLFCSQKTDKLVQKIFSYCRIWMFPKMPKSYDIKYLNEEIIIFEKKRGKRNLKVIRKVRPEFPFFFDNKK